MFAAAEWVVHWKCVCMHVCWKLHFAVVPCQKYSTDFGEVLIVAYYSRLLCKYSIVLAKYRLQHWSRICQFNNHSYLKQG